MHDTKPHFLVLVEQIAQWCINRASEGDVDTDTLVDNLASLIKRVIAAKRH